MPYTETHEITIGPITLPDGVSIEAAVATGTGGQQQVRIKASTPSKADTVALLQHAFALLIVAATAEGVGAPVFQSPGTAPAEVVPGSVVVTP